MIHFRIISIFMTIAMFFVMIQATPYGGAYLSMYENIKLSLLNSIDKVHEEETKNISDSTVLFKNGTNSTDLAKAGTNSTKLADLNANVTTQPGGSVRTMISLGSLVFAAVAFIASLVF
ncbi:uncharacterized protein T551_00841 [Pneumocystis jirovecii RU7]|uniref:Uncharacterized protein n=1 Tax=Pneumocystis jirovecii (strain RU7) TaxID=1408657 RepID=A0A0W4ZUX4_PNEJ7|nr:uncharacterized protein T551_00841 [Pneumocystis jirovecii RU7]KTW32159.1 hypothetical protein T551_00841 [Pneumocystis jirovecii RU7]